ncbi:MULTISPECIES: DUF397 domain-containing protein [unclassified Streptomyces]|uniref:DUF397 domain-containing protein n=1 Tax=unclassified Streptomyces TaxID=2593676 RepID=UPI003814D5B0
MTAGPCLRWRTSSHSDNGGNCVEVATDLVASLGTVPVRDSKQAEGPTLTVAAAAFAGFVAGLRDGAWMP